MFTYLAETQDPKGVLIMYRSMEEMLEEVKVRTRVEHIRIIMEKLQYTAQQAMDLLKIPADEQPKYLAKI